MAKKINIEMELPDVRVSQWKIKPYSVERIAESLQTETGMPHNLAKEIANEVTIRLFNSRCKTLSAPLIREVCNEIMIEKGLENYRSSYTRVGMPVYDVKKLFDEGIKENANQNFNPESIHFWKADRVSEEFALVYAIKQYELENDLKCPSLVDAHLRGDIHIHKLRFFMDRPFCANWDGRMILYLGLPPGGSPHFSYAKPAKNPIVAFLHLAKWYGIIQGLYQGGQGYDNICAFLAPYVRGLSNEETEQLAQCMIFETNQIYASRAQVPFTSIDTEPGIPKEIQDVKAIIPGGKLDGSVYGDYEDEAEKLFLAFNKVYRQGDGSGRLFNFPKHEIKTRRDMWMKHQDAYYDAHVTTAKMGDGYYLLSEQYSHSQCLPYNEKLISRIDGEIQHIKIGDLITSEMMNQSIKQDKSIWFSPKQKIEVLSLNPENKKIEFKSVTNMLFNSQRSQIIKITTEDGLQTQTNENHPFIVLNCKEQRFIIKRSSEIREGDYILKMNSWNVDESEQPLHFDLIDFLSKNKNLSYQISVNNFNESLLLEEEKDIKIHKTRRKNALYLDEYLQLEKNKNERKNLKLYPKGGKGHISAIIPYNQDLMTFIGWYLAEGSINKNRGIRLSFNPNEKEFINEAREKIEKVFNLKTKESIQIDPEKNYNHCNIEVNSYILLELLKFWNIGNDSHSKRVPNFVFQLSNEKIKYLIRSLFLGDGYSRVSDKKIEISLHITSEQLIQDIRYLLLRFGINSYINRREKSFNLNIEQGDSIKKFLDLIPEWKEKYEKNPPPERKAIHPVRSEKYPASLFINVNLIKDKIIRKMIYTAIWREGKIGINIISKIPKESISPILKQLISSKDFSLTQIIKKEYIGSINNFYDIEIGELGKNGNFVHSDGIITHNCCRLIQSAGNLKRFCKNMDKLDWHKSYMNIGALQTVSINLPRIAYLANGNDDKFFEILDERLLQCIEIFMLKKQLLENRYTSGKIEILNNMVSFPGETEKQLLFDFEKQSVVIGFVGGNEMCLAHTGHEIHEGNGALTFMTKVLKYMAQRCDEYSVEKQYNIALWEQPAESTCGRFASLDAEQFKDKCICQGKDSKSYYYTNSSHIRYGADVSLSKIIQIQSQFHPIVQGGVITHIWLGEAVSDPDALMKMTERIMGTPTLYFAYTFDFSQCTDCNLFVKGVLKTCPNCKSDKIEIYSRITGYYARVSRFGDSKFQEWKDRKRHNSL